MMNYQTMMPNYYCLTPLRTPSYAPITPQKENKSFSNVLLLNTIAQALNVSLKNYEQQLSNNSNAASKIQSQTVLPREKPNNSEKPIEIIISEEELESKTSKPVIQQQSPNSPLKPALQAEKPNNLTLQLPTDDQNLHESKETSNKKAKDSKQNNRKNRCEAPIDNFQVIIPEVDLIDCAYLSQTVFDYDSLVNKKEQLMNRKVNDWNEFVKGKKQRREIRMLGN